MQDSLYHTQSDLARFVPSQSRFTGYEPPQVVNFAAGIELDWESEPLPEHAPKDRTAEWARANAYDKFCRKNYEPREAAYRYVADFPDYARDKFYSTGRQRYSAAQAALRPLGWGTRLLAQLDYPKTPIYFYSLHMGHLGLPDSYADPRFIYYQAVVDEIKAAIAEHIPSPYHWKLEVGQRSGVHVHIIGPFAPKLAHLIFDGSRVVEPVYEPVGLLCYLEKPVATFTAENYATYLEAKEIRPRTGKGRNVPKLSGQPGLKRPRKGKA